MYALKYRPADYLFDIDTYRRFSDVYIAPWNILAYTINIGLFGIEPRPFFLRQVLSAFILFFITFLFLRIWVSSVWSAFGTVLVAIAPSTAIVTSQLMNVHYLEGLSFALVSAVFFVAAIQHRSHKASVVGAAFYFLAMAAKELYVPLLAVFLFLPYSDLQNRLRHLLPFLLAALAYFAWRTSFIESSFDVWLVTSNITDLLLAFPRSVMHIIGNDWIAAACFAIFVLCFSIFAYLYPRTRLFMVVLAFCLIAPLLPVSWARDTERFHLFLSWVAFCGLVIYASHSLRTERISKSVLIVILAILTVAVVTQSLERVEGLKRQNHRFAAVGKFILTHDEQSYLYIPGRNLPANDIVRFKKAIGSGNGPKLLYDPIQFEWLLLRPWDQQDYPFYVYDHSKPGISKMPGGPQSTIETWQDRVADKKLNIELHNTDSGTVWKLGPYQDRKYMVVLLSRGMAFNGMAPSGIYRGVLGPMEFVLRYTSRDGWITYSDVLQWKNEPGEKLVWSRD